MASIFVDEGELEALEQLLKDGTSNYLRLGVGSLPGETDTLTDLTEVSGNGYAAETVTGDGTGWPTVALDSGDYQAQSKQVTFTATGTWTTAAFAYLATSSDDSGRLISAVDLPTAKTLSSGDTLAVTFKLKIS